MPLEASPETPPKKTKPEQEEEDKENIPSSSNLTNVPTALTGNNRIKSISSCCNLKIVAAIIFALSVSLLGSFYKNYNVKCYDIPY